MKGSWLIISGNRVIIIIMMKMIDDEFGTDFLFLNNDLSSSETQEIKQTLLNDRFFLLLLLERRWWLLWLKKTVWLFCTVMLRRNLTCLAGVSHSEAVTLNWADVVGQSFPVTCTTTFIDSSDCYYLLSNMDPHPHTHNSVRHGSTFNIDAYERLLPFTELTA